MVNYSLLLYIMGIEKITKETDLMRLDKGLVRRIRAHKDVSGVPMAVFVEKCVEKELRLLYPSGEIK